MSSVKEVNSMADVKEEFIYRDCVRGTKGMHVLNKRDISDREMGMIFNSWVYEGSNYE